MQTNLSLVPTRKQFKSTQAESIGRSPAEKAITLQKQLYYSTVMAGRQDAEGHPHFCDYPMEFSPMHLACEMTRFSLDMFLQSKWFCFWASIAIIRWLCSLWDLSFRFAVLHRAQWALLFNSLVEVITSFSGSAIMYSLETVSLPLYKTQRNIIWPLLVIESSGFLFKCLPLFVVSLHFFFLFFFFFFLSLCKHIHWCDRLETAIKWLMKTVFWPCCGNICCRNILC